MMDILLSQIRSKYDYRMYICMYVVVQPEPNSEHKNSLYIYLCYL